MQAVDVPLADLRMNGGVRLGSNLQGQAGIQTMNIEPSGSAFKYPIRF